MLCCVARWIRIYGNLVSRDGGLTVCDNLWLRFSNTGETRWQNTRSRSTAENFSLHLRVSEDEQVSSFDGVDSLRTSVVAAVEEAR
jgi:hypothetical protein